MKPLALLLRASLLASAALLATLPAHAVGRLVDVNLIDRDSGARLPVYRHEGQWWVAGQPGARYAIELRNRAGARVLGVLAIDGVNAISGDTAAWSQTGYVLARRQLARITGWRKSDAEVAAFHFTELPRSYAARTGRPEHVGVIGVAVFHERERPPPVASIAQEAPAGRAREAEAASDATASARRAAPPAPARLGTGHGARETSWVTHTQFERRDTQPDEVITIRYDRRENLVALGVIPPTPEPAGVPAAFPQSMAGHGYTPDPPAWR